MRTLAYATCAYVLAAGGVEAFSPGLQAPIGRSHGRTGMLSLRAAGEHGASVNRRQFFVAGAAVAGFAQLSAPQAASAFDFRKAITGEEEGKERAYLREKKAQEANKGGSCDMYECYSVQDNDLKGTLERVDLDGISIMAPAKNDFEATEGSGLAAQWKDKSGAFVEIKVETNDAFTFEITPSDKIPKPPLGGSNLKLNIAGVGALVARERSAQTREKHTYVNGRARLIEGTGEVVYVLGVKKEDGEPQTVLVAITQKNGKTYQVSCGAAVKDFKKYRDQFQQILSSVTVS